MNKKIVKPINDSLENLADSIVNPSGEKSIHNNGLTVKKMQNPIRNDAQLNLFIDKQKEKKGMIYC